MKGYFRPFILLSIVLMVMASCEKVETSPSATKPDYDKLKTEVNDLLTYSMQVFAEKDLEGMVGRFTADGSLKIPNTPLLTGTDAIRAYYAGTIQLENLDLQIATQRVDVSEAGDMAYVMGTFAISFNTPGGPFSDGGNSLLVLVREDGVWKIAAECLSSSPPPSAQ